MKVLVDAGKEFSNVEMVKGQASKKLASATASPVKSCWGHMFLEVEARPHPAMTPPLMLASAARALP